MRKPHEIIKKIVECVEESGKTQTDIVRSLGIHTYKAQEYLKILEDKKYIYRSGNVYTITSIGREAIGK